MRIGILGGSFNPPHLGHLALARTVLEQELADAVVLIPAAIPPHKTAPQEADAATRFAMARLLAEEDPGLTVDDLELRRSGPSFTIDTVRQLAAAHPGNVYRLIIGSDMAKSFATWREFRDILRLTPPLVAERPDAVFGEGDAAVRYPGLAPEEVAIMERGRFSMTPVAVSSTMVRKLLAAGAGDGELLSCLTAKVLAFIRDRKLYGIPARV